MLRPVLSPAKPPIRARVHARWRRSFLNPYFIDLKLLRGRITELKDEMRGRLLDVGCGERPYQAMFDVERYVGIEHLGAVINVSSRLEDYVGHVAHLVDSFADGERLPFRDEVFDSALCIEVLEHVRAPEMVAEEMFRVLRPGGAALIAVPFVGELHQTPFDYRRYTTFGIRLLLEDAGFQVEQVLARGNFLATAGRVLAHAIYRLGAKRLNNDGSVTMRKWAMPLVLPLCGLTLSLFGLAAKFSKDETLCLGYVVLARKPGQPGDA